MLLLLFWLHRARPRRVLLPRPDPSGLRSEGSGPPPGPGPGSSGGFSSGPRPRILGRAAAYRRLRHRSWRGGVPGSRGRDRRSEGGGPASASPYEDLVLGDALELALVPGVMFCGLLLAAAPARPVDVLERHASRFARSDILQCFANCSSLSSPRGNFMRNVGPGKAPWRKSIGAKGCARRRPPALVRREIPM